MDLAVDITGATGDVQVLENVFEDLNTTLETVASTMERVVDALSPDESAFNGVLEGIDAFNIFADGRTNLEGLCEALNNGAEAAKKSGEGFSILKALIPETSAQIGSALEPVVNIFGAMKTAFSGTTMIWITAIGAVIAAVVLLVQNWDTVKAGLIAGWEAVKAAFGAAVEWIRGVIQNGMAFIQGLFLGVDEFLQNVFTTNWTERFGFLGSILNGFFANVANVWDAVKTVFQGVVDFVSSVFAGDWKGAWEGIVTVFSGIWEGIVAFLKTPINGAIGVVNGFLKSVEMVVNAVIGLLNGISVEVPDWEIFGDLAGNTYGFNIAPVSLPQIPQLAKGAVLPANRPFLAMVGDQRHGTNVEAPLATIQEAVALVMDDQLSAMMAGFEAVVREQQAIRAVVEGIEVGDEVIGRAAARYGARMAVVRGS